MSNEVLVFLTALKDFFLVLLEKKECCYCTHFKQKLYNSGKRSSTNDVDDFRRVVYRIYSKVLKLFFSFDTLDYIWLVSARAPRLGKTTITEQCTTAAVATFYSTKSR